MNLIKKLFLSPILLSLIFMFCLKTTAQTKKVIKTKAFKVSATKKKDLKITKKDVFIYSKQANDSNLTEGVKDINAENYNIATDSPIYNSDYLLLSERPEFIGGKETLYKYVANNYKVPNETGLKGKIFMQFVVETDGSLTDIKCLRDIGHGSGQEAVRVLLASPKWKPAILEGKPIRCTYQLPIMIESPE